MQVQGLVTAVLMVSNLCSIHRPSLRYYYLLLVMRQIEKSSMCQLHVMGFPGPEDSVLMGSSTRNSKMGSILWRTTFRTMFCMHGDCGMFHVWKYRTLHDALTPCCLRPWATHRTCHLISIFYPHVHSLSTHRAPCFNLKYLITLNICATLSMPSATPQLG